MCLALSIMSFLQLDGHAYADYDMFASAQGVDIVEGVKQVAQTIKKVTEPKTCHEPEAKPSPRCDSYALNVMPKERDAVLRYDFPTMAESEDGDPFSWLMRDPSSSYNAYRTRTCQVFIEASGLDDILAGIKKVGAHCGYPCLKRVNIDSHGSPGVVSDIFSTYDVKIAGGNKLAEARAVMAPGAEVRLLGCSIGAGKSGEELLALIGQRLLSQNGGTVRAFTSTSMTNPFAFNAKDVTFSTGPMALYYQPPGGGTGFYNLICPGLGITTLE